MARRILTFAQFQPSLWPPSKSYVDNGETVFEVQVRAPEETNRSTLRSRFIAREPVLDSAFNLFLVKHDVLMTVQAYANGRDITRYVPEEGHAGGTDKDDETVESHSYVQPREYLVHEFKSEPGKLYVGVSEPTVRQIFTRCKQAGLASNVVLYRRVVRLRDLEQELEHASIVGYKLTDVLLSTPISSYEVLGQQIADNDEVQDAKLRAASIKTLTFNIQTGLTVLRVQIASTGAVTFLNYPGDDSALEFLNELEPLLNRHSDLESVLRR